MNSEMKVCVYWCGLLLLLMLTIYSCNNKNTMPLLLLEAESLIQQYPDSSLNILEKIEYPEELPKEQFATWCLLITQAKDKSYIKHTTDSIIAIAVDYFEDKNNVERKVLSYYYMGRVSQDLRNAPKAQDYYLKALNASDNSTDKALKGRICANLGFLYTQQDISELAIPYLKEALNYFEILNDSINQSFVLRDIGRIYTLQKEVDSAVIYYQKALPLVDMYNRSIIYNELGILHTDKEEYDIAFDCIQTSLKNATNTSRLYPVYITLGRYFLQTNRLDSAEFYLNKSIQSPHLTTKASAYYYLYKLAYKRKDWKKYVDFQEKYEVLRDSIRKKSNTESIIKVQNLYDYQQATTELNKIKLSHTVSTKNNYRLALVIVILMVGSLALYFYMHKNKREWKKQERSFQLSKKKILRERQDQIMENKKRIEELEIELQKNKDLEQSLIQSEKRRLELENERLAHTHYEKELLINEFEKSEIYNKFSRQADFRPTESAIKELKESIDRIYPNFIVNLIQLLPTISENELFMCYLLKAGLKPTRIAKIMHVEKQTITMRRSRLYKKISGKEGTADMLDEFISSI